MESFGLFNFLQSLLSANPSEPPKSDRPTDAEPSPAEPPTDAPPTTPREPVITPNAFLDFAQRHDERAKRTRHK